ncbi:MAG: metal-dependent hydrolase, partial [Gemmatimonadales bacterium]
GLDLLTRFGTAVLWPLTPRRFGLGWLYLVDPIVIALVGVGLILSIRALPSRTTAPRWAWGLLAAYVVVAGLLAQAADVEWGRRLAGGGVTAARRAVVPVFPGPWRWAGIAETDGALYRATSSIGGWSAVPLTTFPKVPVDGLGELDRSPAVLAFRAFARFPWLTVSADGDLRRVEYRDLAFEDHPFGGPMALRLTVDQSGSVRAVELGHRL